MMSMPKQDVKYLTNKTIRALTQLCREVIMYCEGRSMSMRRKRREQREERRQHVEEYKQQEQRSTAEAAAAQVKAHEMEMKAAHAEAATWHAREAEEQRAHAGRAAATAARCAQRAAKRKATARSTEQNMHTNMPQVTNAGHSEQERTVTTTPDVSSVATTAAHAIERNAKRDRSSCTDYEQAQNISFIVAMHAHAAVWVHEVYVSSQHRQRGVATWLIHAVAGEQQVELQVRSDVKGESARRAYRRMGLRTRRTRAKGVVYESASEGYELMYTECMVVRSAWEPTCRIERYKNSEVPGAVLDEMAHNVYMHKYGEDGARECDEMREIRENIKDCTRGDMIYVVIRHNKRTQDDRCERKDEGDALSGGSGATAMPVGTRCGGGTQTSSMSSGTRVRRRQLRRPTTSALSDKVWREMRKHITGRAQDDGVT